MMIDIAELMILAWMTSDTVVYMILTLTQDTGVSGNKNSALMILHIFLWIWMDLVCNETRWLVFILSG